MAVQPRDNGGGNPLAAAFAPWPEGIGGLNHGPMRRLDQGIGEMRARGCAAAAERFRWILPEQRMIVVREASKLDEAVLDGDPGDGDLRRVAVSQDRMDGAKPFVTQERDRSQAENFIKGAMQTP